MSTKILNDGNHNSLRAGPKNLKRKARPGNEAWVQTWLLALAILKKETETKKNQVGPKLPQAVFAEYARLTDAKRPKSDDEKRDQWLVRLSHHAGKNLEPFFKAWGVPTSEGARAAVSRLPDCMPNGFEQKR